MQPPLLCARSAHSSKRFLFKLFISLENAFGVSLIFDYYIEKRGYHGLSWYSLFKIGIYTTLKNKVVPLETYG